MLLYTTYLTFEMFPLHMLNLSIKTITKTTPSPTKIYLDNKQNYSYVPFIKLNFN